jgi:hypothetical protein
MFNYLFICGLFNDTVSSSDYIASNDRVITNNEQERIWKEAVVTYCKVLSRHLPGGTEENHESH